MLKNEYYIKTSVTEDDLSCMIALDNSNYQTDSYRGETNLCKEWLRKNDEIYTVLMFNEIVVGYINFMPLKKQSYEKFQKGEITDCDIRFDDILPFSNNEQCGLFASIVVHKNHRQKNAIRMLFEAFFEKLHNYHIKKFVCTAVSNEGERVIRKFKNYAEVALDEKGNKVFEVIVE